MLSRLSLSSICEDLEIMELFGILEEHGHNIRELHLAYEFNIKPCFLLKMPTVLNGLTSLTLQGVSLCSDDGVGYAAERGSHIVPVLLGILGNLCSNLRHFELNLYYSIYKDDLDDLLFGLKDSLVSLKLSPFCDERRLDGLPVEHSPFTHCMLLEELWMHSCPNAEDMMAIGRLGSLKELTMMGSSIKIKDEDYKNAFKQQKMNSLKKFKLTGQSEFGKKATMAMLKYCPNLLYVTFSCCFDQISLDGLEEAVADCGPRMIKLQRLAFLSCVLSRSSIMAVARLCNLRELSICGSNYPALTKEDYRDAFQQGDLINLEVLTLKKCYNLDSEGLQALLKVGLKLRHVNLEELRGVTGYALIFGECNLKYLESFCAIKCPGFQDGDVNVLKKRCPRL
jgi:hypothetical protein